MTQQKVSYCRGCISHCGLLFDVEDNRILAHSGDKQSPVSEGYKCIKGDLSVEFINGAEFRYENSQKRGDDGELHPIANDVLLDELAEKIRASIDKYGPRSVALYWGTAGYRKIFGLSLARQFMAAIDSPLLFSTMTIDQSAHWVVEGRMGMFPTGKPSIFDADVIVQAGANPVVSHSGPYDGVPLVGHTAKFREFKKQGKDIIVIDPRKSETARQATLHLQPLPGTDTEIFAGIIRLILANNWHDTAFCERFVTTLEQLRDSVAPFTPELVESRSKVPAKDLLRAAEIIGAARRPCIGFSTGLAMSPHGNTSGHMVEALNAICGGFNRAGDPVRNPGVMSRRPLQERVIPPTRSWEKEPKLRSGHGRLYGEFPTSRLLDEILTGGKEQIKVLIVLGANPMVAFGQPDKTARALKQLDTLVVIEPRATETTALADYVVAPPLQYEVPDINLGHAAINVEKALVQYTEAVVAPPPGTLHEWQFFNGLANRLGHTLKASQAGVGRISKRGAAISTEREWTTEELIAAMVEESGMSMDMLRAHPHGLVLEVGEQKYAAAGEDDGYRLHVCPDDVAAELAGIAAVQDNGTQEGYKLINRRVIELMNSEFRDTVAVKRRFPEHYAPLYMHPDDLAREGFAKGQKVTVKGEHGSVTAIATPDRSMLPSVVAMPHCYGRGEQGDAHSSHSSWLVSMELEKVANIDAMPQQSSLPVSLSAC